jgi:hypothetical protein
MLTLNQQRALHSFREFVFPECLEKLRAAASFDVSLEVDWDSLAEIDYLHMIVPNLLKVYFIPLTEALRQITVDTLGSNALRNSLRQIVIRNSGHIRDAQKYSVFENSTLTLDHLPNANVDSVAQRVQAILRELESKL